MLKNKIQLSEIQRSYWLYAVIHESGSTQLGSRQNKAPKSCIVPEGFIEQSEQEQGSYSGQKQTGYYCKITFLI